MPCLAVKGTNLMISHGGGGGGAAMGVDMKWVKCFSFMYLFIFYFTVPIPSNRGRRAPQCRRGRRVFSTPASPRERSQYRCGALLLNDGNSAFNERVVNAVWEKFGNFFLFKICRCFLTIMRLQPVGKLSPSVNQPPFRLVPYS